MGAVFTFHLPTYVDLPRRGKKDLRVYMNLNTYRNLHYHVNNNAKKAYKKLIQDQLDRCPVFKRPVKITFRLIKCTKRRTDKSNFYAILSKFTFDYLTEEGKWEDDNDDVILEEKLCPTEYEKGEANMAMITIQEIY